MDHNYANNTSSLLGPSVEIQIADESNTASNQEIATLKNSIVTEVKTMLNDFKQSLNAGDETLSIIAPSRDSELLPNGNTLETSSGENLPGGHPPEKRLRPLSDDDFSDLLPKRQKMDNPTSTSSSDDLTNDFFDLVDQEMPVNILHGAEVPAKLASRIMGHFVEKSNNAEARKLICDRHKLPANCSAICVPKLRESILQMKSFNEYSRRQEKSLFILQSSIIQASSCFVDLLADAIQAEDNSKVIDTRLLLRNCFDGVALLGHASRSVSNMRKRNLKSCLDTKYQALCNPSRPTSEYLLGDDLDKGVREAIESTKLAKSYSPHGSSSDRGKRYKHSSAPIKEAQKSGSFLERGQKQHTRQKTNNQNTSSSNSTYKKRSKTSN